LGTIFAEDKSPHTPTPTSTVPLPPLPLLPPSPPPKRLRDLGTLPHLPDHCLPNQPPAAIRCPRPAPRRAEGLDPGTIACACGVVAEDSGRGLFKPSGDRLVPKEIRGWGGWIPQLPSRTRGWWCGVVVVVGWWFGYPLLLHVHQFPKYLPKEENKPPNNHCQTLQS